MKLKNVFARKREVMVASKGQVRVKEIHDEFNSASEKLLVEAKKIIAGQNEKINYEKLKLLGFYKSKPAKDYDRVLENKKLAESIWYYGQHYPFNKFITHLQVGTICEKYGLVFSEPFRYIGDIPEKNILEMQSFKLRDQDCKYFVTGPLIPQYNSGPEFSTHPGNVSFVVGYSSTTDLYPINFQHTLSFAQAQEKIAADPLYTMQKQGDKFFICAPKKFFDMTRSKVIGFQIETDDPIVLCQVDGGYLIVTLWGDEASDKDLINEKKN